MQPQLFVCTGCKQLMEVLEEFADTMCFRRGGVKSLILALESEKVATAQYSSGLQVSGIISDVITDRDGNEAYIKTAGKTSLAWNNEELPGHGTDYHHEGFGSPVGRLQGFEKPLEDCSDTELQAGGIESGKRTELIFESGVIVNGLIREIVNHNGKNLLLTLENCTVITAGGEVLFRPEWGDYDMAIGERITSVFAGSADKHRFDINPPVPRSKAIEIEHSADELYLYDLYQQIREMREKGIIEKTKLEKVHSELQHKYPDDWLLRIELLEASCAAGIGGTLERSLTQELKSLMADSDEKKQLIESGLMLAKIPTDQLYPR